MSNADVYRRMMDRLWHSDEDPELVIGEYFAPEYEATDPIRPRAGQSGVAKLVREVRAAIGDLRYEVHDTLEQGDMVAARWTLTGVHRATLFGAPATGKPVEAGGMSMNRFVGGKIVEGYVQWDVMSLLRQIGGKAQPPLKLT